MKKVRVEDAVGLALCHDITAIRDGFKGRAFARGHVISESDVEKLKDIGKTHVYIWEDQPGIIHEEDAALRLAALCPMEHGSYTGPSEGKMNLTAQEDGLFVVNTDLLYQINSLKDVTVTALPSHFPVEKGTKVAAMRIVPLMTEEENVIQAEALAAAAEQPLFRLVPYRKDLKAAVIITGSEIYTGRIKDRFEPVVRAKLRAYGAEVISCVYSDDKEEMLDALVSRALEMSPDMLILTGGMSVDPDDLTPSAIRRSGAEIICQGTPVQPGNMFMLGYLGKTAIMGVPGASIHNPITIFDLVLPQIITGEHLTREDFIRLGNGGLCMNCAQCHWPRCTFGRY